MSAVPGESGRRPRDVEPGRRQIPLVVLGPGAVGQAFLELVTRERRRHANLGFRLTLMAVVDSSTALVRSPEISSAALRALLAAKAAGRPLPNGVDLASFGALTPQSLDQPSDGRSTVGIVVDTSAADTTATLSRFAAAGWGIVLANKVPLCGTIGAFRRLTRTGRLSRWETTVASALPVVGPLTGLIAVGDEVTSIRGALSGTLGFVLARTGQGEALTSAVQTAIARGYAEPDPRTDLAGLDVARKGLILSRMLGYNGSIGDVIHESLFPQTWEELSAAHFMDRLPELDAGLQAAHSRAARAGAALRYVVNVTALGVRCGLEAVGPSDPLGRIAATDSAAVVHSRLFDTNPLVVSGRGAGARMTAAGVLADVVSLARDRLP
jgi:homoserine dehydrogenase